VTTTIAQAVLIQSLDMTGFTPINSHAASAPSTTTNDTFTESKPDADRQKTTRRRQPARKKPSPPDAESPEAAPKRISGKGRKRTNEPSDESGSKRRKSGSVELNMPITEPSVRPSEAKQPKHTTNSNVAGTSSTDAEVISLVSKAKLDDFRCSNTAAAEANTSQQSKSATPHRVSLPQTSMDSVSKERQGFTWRLACKLRISATIMFDADTESYTDMRVF